MIKLIDNMAIIGGDNELPLLAYKALKKKYKNSVYINLSFKNARTKRSTAVAMALVQDEKVTKRLKTQIKTTSR